VSEFGNGELSLDASVHYWTAGRLMRPYTANMPLEYVKKGIAGAWIVGLAVAAAFLGLSTILGWTVLVVLGLLPPLVMMRMWNPPSQTTSESIRNVLR
jgi:hypothetical protein